LLILVARIAAANAKQVGTNIETRESAIAVALENCTWSEAKPSLNSTMGQTNSAAKAIAKKHTKPVDGRFIDSSKT
jgi:hypothetical protein